MIAEISANAKMEKISVIMSVYNENEEELKESIESILGQTYKKFEFIIIIDNPVEKWRIDYIKKYKDERIKLIVNDENIGLPKSLNKGLEYATGEYIARMDADDISMPMRFEKQIEFLKKKGYDLCGSNIADFANEKILKKKFYPENVEDIRKMLFIKNCVPHSTFFGKKEVFLKLNGYTNIFSCEDYDFLLRAVNNNIKIGNVQEILLKYRIRPQGICISNSGKQELISIYIRKFYRKNKDLIVSEEMIENFIDSKEFKKKIKNYNFYSEIKNRCKYMNKKQIKYYIYMIFLLLNFKYSTRLMFSKLMEWKYIIIAKKRNKKNIVE